MAVEALVKHHDFSFFTKNTTCLGTKDIEQRLLIEIPPLATGNECLTIVNLLPDYGYTEVYRLCCVAAMLDRRGELYM